MSSWRILERAWNNPKTKIDLFIHNNVSINLYEDSDVFACCHRWIPYARGFQTFFHATQISASKSYTTQKREKKEKKKGELVELHSVPRSLGLFLSLDTRGAGPHFHDFYDNFFNFEEDWMLRHLVRLWLKNGFIMVSLYNVKSEFFTLLT